MKTSLFKLQLLLIALLLGFNSSRAQEYTYYRTVAMYIPAEGINAIDSDQEKAAANLFQNTTFEGNTEKKLITPSKINEISYPEIDCLWIHIDRKGLNEGVSQLPEAYRNPEFINKVREFHKNGGNLYLSKFAVQLLFPEGIDRLPAYLKPNVFNSSKEDDKGDIWSINAEIGAVGKNKDTHDQYLDKSTHPIYAGLTTLAHNEWPAAPDHIYDVNPYRVFPMQGKSNHETIHREDHNCMWRVAFKSNDNAKVGIYTGFSDVHSWADLYTKDGDKWVETKKCQEIKAAAPQELAALYFMLCPDSELYKKRPGVHVEVICPGDIDRIKDYANFDCIWIHIDRCGLDSGFDKLPEAYRRTDLIEALTGYCKDGRALLLTKHATQLIPELGRIGKDFTPNIFGSADGGKGTDVWTLNAQIGWENHEADPSQYYDHRDHAIYNDMERGTGWFVWETFPMEGTGNGTEMWREDHNCMWDLNALTYSADGENTVEKFENQHHATVLGTWGHVQNYAVAAIIEFRPTPDFRGRIIANGLAAYELAPRNGGNAFQKNLELLTFNCLSYLCTVTDFRFVNDGPNGVVRFQSDANATVLGTWGQDWNHQAAGIVEFHPTAATYAAGDDDPASLVEVNKNKAARGSVIANGIACVQLHHEANNNDFQDNANKLTVNAMDYLTPWHSRIALGVENVSGDSAKGKVSASEGRLTWTGFNAPVLLEVYSVDGSLLRSMMIEGESSADIDARGIVVINAGGSVCKAIL